jgi:hypothetical protein
MVARDAARAAASPLLPLSVGARDGALAAAIAWLCRSHDATGRRGSSKAFSLRHGWLPAYPETTGYVLGTLLEYAHRTTPLVDLVDHAREMGDWEKAIQEADGGIMEGHVETRPRRSIVFNTGMVLHGWVDLVQTGYAGFEEAADRACGFLVENLRRDGTWSPEFEYGGIPHVYNTRVAWAMIRWAREAGRPEAEVAARAQLNWACLQQRANGWFDRCVFRNGMMPSTHALAYTLRGLLESYSLTGEEPWLRAVERTAEALRLRIDQRGPLSATFDAEWGAAATYSCLTGTAQLGIVWLRLFQETGENRWLHAGLKAVEQAAGRQEKGGLPAVGGGLPGSFPIWGRYAPLQYPNWATKFLADALMLYEDCLTGATEAGVGSVAPGAASSRPASTNAVSARPSAR